MPGCAEFGGVTRRVPLMGHHYTMSAMKHPCGDRSWCHDIWKVLESNGTHVVIQNAFPRHPHSYGSAPMVVVVTEFDWTPADELAEAISAQSTSKSESIS